MLSQNPLTQVDAALLLRKHYDFQQGCFVSELQDAAGGLFAFSEITPVPMWNHVAWMGGTEAQFAEVIGLGSAWQSGRNRRPVIYVPEPTAEQVDRLRAAGFDKFDEEAWMVCAELEPAPRTNSSVKSVNAISLGEFIKVFSDSFQIKEAGYSRVLKQAPTNGQAHSQHFILFDNQSIPASVGTLISEGEIGCIYNIGTPPDKRGRGFGGRLFEHIAAVARENGCTTLFLQVENKSAAQHLYEKHGFRTAFIRAGFRLAAWKSAHVERTKLSNLLNFRSAERSTNRYVRETRSIPAETCNYLTKFNDPVGLENICITAWAYLLHRYTGEEIATFTTCGLSQLIKRPISVAIDRTAKIKELLGKQPVAPAHSEIEARESFLCVHQHKNPSHLDENQFPLEVHFLGETGRIEIIFRSDLFSKDSIRRMGAHLTTILDYIVHHPEALVSDIELLSAAEKHQVLVEWNQSSFEASTQSLIHLFEAQVEKTPDATALLLARTGTSQPAEQMTYRQLNRRANRLA
ncbi:MAG: GNAT family N-acetyltransferase, partial [Armatimonadetes bacterium]|nr:GNAT family N-acetyltransferase [Akkermansiaceae bacterium]